MAKINLAITVDNHVNTWLNEQKEKRSTLINRILNEYIQNLQPKVVQRVQDNQMVCPRTGDFVFIKWNDFEREAMYAKLGYKMVYNWGEEEWNGNILNW